MKTKFLKRVLSILLIISLSIGMVPDIFLAENNDNAEDTTRYTVLLLDVEKGFSMYSGDVEIYKVETPIETVRKAANKFIQQMETAKGTNYVAIVTYSSEAVVDMEFTEDTQQLKDSISNIETREGLANINDAFLKADTLLSEVKDENAIKNIVHFTQGVAGEGDYSLDGLYIKDDCSWYRPDNEIYLYQYANAAYNTAQILKEKYNLYAIGLFQSFESVPEGGKSLLNFAKRFSEDIQDSGFQDVDNVDELIFAFGEVAEDITQDTLKQLYINQHIEYVQSEEYKNEIISGYESYLLEIFNDAQKNIMVSSYNMLDVINKGLNLEVKLNDVDMYELILAELLYNEQSRNQMQKIYENNIAEQIVSVLKKILENKEIKDLINKDGNVSEYLNGLLNKLATLSTLSEEHYKVYSEILDTLAKKNVKVKQITDALSENTFVINAMIGTGVETFNTITEVIEYIIHANAYMNTSEEFKYVLLTLSLVAKLGIDVKDEDKFNQIGAIEGILNTNAFDTAILSFLDEMESYRLKGAIAVAEYAISKSVDGATSIAQNTLKDIGVTSVEILLSGIPILNTIPIAKKALENGQLIIDIFTGIDEAAYCADMLCKIYYITLFMDDVVDLCADKISIDEFSNAAIFDTAINVYKSIVSIACDYGMKYAEECLVASIANSVIYAKQASRYSRLMNLISEQKLMCKDIQCHSVGLDYDSNTGEITYNDKELKVFTIACPVDVIVKTDTGEQIAFLSNQDSWIKSGYEKYFFTYEIEENSQDYVKVAIVPDSYEVTLKGSGTGTMNVYVANYIDLEQQEVESFINIPITENSEGYFIDSVENEGLEDLIVDGTTYVGNTSEAGHTYMEPVFVWGEDYSSCVASFSCIECDDVQNMDCIVTTETIPATENADGKTTYTATITFNETIYTDTKTKVIPAIQETIPEDTEMKPDEPQEDTGSTEEKEDNKENEEVKSPSTGENDSLILWDSIVIIFLLSVIVVTRVLQEKKLNS